MKYGTVTEHLSLVGYNVYRPNSLLVNKARGLTGKNSLTAAEIKELALSHDHIYSLYQRTTNSIVTLAEEVVKLRAENEFMLKLIQSRMETEAP